jgi:hypothetical protein
MVLVRLRMCYFILVMNIFEGNYAFGELEAAPISLLIISKFPNTSPRTMLWCASEGNFGQ